MPAANEVVVKIKGVDNTSKAFASVKKSLHSFQQSIFSVKSAVAGLTAAFGVGQMTKFLDTATRIENRLKLVTKSSEELVKAQQDVAAIAKLTGQSYEQTANLYSRIIQSTESLNLTTKEQISITQTVAKSLAITGESSESAAAAIKQLGQALASGVLRGEEFNSVSEQAPRVMKALQDSLGVSRGKLRELAKEGALTSEIVAEALLIQAEAVDKEFGKTTRTVAQAYENLNTSAVKFFDILDEKFQISEKFNSAINRMARGLDKVTESMKGATKIELKKQIEELTSAQQKELIELDALVMGHNSLNVMQQNQARILRLNIAERGKHIRELRAEYDELVNGKKAAEDSSSATNENTQQTKEASEASKKLQERLTALRAKLDEKTESTKKATKSVADLSLELEHAYTMGNVTALTYQGVKEVNEELRKADEELKKANEELLKSTIDLSTAMEQNYSMANVTALTYQGVKEINEELRKANEELKKADEELRKANEELLKSTIDLSTAMEHNYTMANVTALTYQGVKEINEELRKANEELKKADEELRKANEELLKSTIDLSVAMEHNYTMGNVTALTYQGVKEINEELRKANEELKKADEELRKANEKLLKSTIDLSVAMEHNYTMGNLNVDAFAAVRDINKEIADSLRETTDSMKEATDSMIELSLAMEHNYTMGNLNVEAFKEMKKAAATAFPKQLAENEYFQGITAAGGAAGARAMTVTKAFAESPEKGLFALVMSNKKVQEALEKVFTAIFALIDPIIDLLAPQIEALIPLFKSLNPLIAKLTPAISKLTPPLEKIIDPLIKLVENVIYLVEKLEEFTDFLEEKLGAFVIALSEVIEAIGGKILEIVTGAFEFLAGIFDALKTLFENTLGPLKTAIETLYNSYLKPILEKLQPLIDAFKPLTDALNDLKNAIESKKDIFEKGGPLDPGGSTGGKFVQGFVSTVASIGSSLGFKNGGMIPKAQNGMLVGASHSMGGTMVAAEGGEYIFSREAVQRLGAGRLNQLNNGQDDGGVVVNIYDGTGQRISAYDSALRVEIKERAARNQQFAAVA